VPVKESAGLLMFRRRGAAVEVLLGHPGGPYWADRDDGAWTLPKGGIQDGETPLDSAIREFAEETGLVSVGPYISLGSIVQRSGKVVHAWAFEGECDPGDVTSNHTTVEWPPRSGRYLEVPEIDRADFFEPKRARRAINPAQAVLIDRLTSALGSERTRKA
jgi:predicted NUDIX family NTP pyrophosphohydrolase